jgi:putative spermidine/putrescine transport system permease protein
MTDGTDAAELRTDGGTTTGSRTVLGRFDPSAAFGRPLVVGALAVTLLFLLVPILLTLVASFASDWTGILPAGFVTLDNWRHALGIGLEVGSRRGVGSGLAFSVLLATGGMVLNIFVGVPIAYAVTRYDFVGRDWINAMAILPIAPGIVLGVAFLKTYPQYAGSALSLIVAYSILKSPFMVLTVQSSFQSMDLRQLEESGRALGASWLRTFVTVIVPNAKGGIMAGSIITWILAAAEFNFTWLVYSRGPKPFSLFLYSNITRSPILAAAAAVSIYFLIVTVAVLVLQFVGGTGFTTVRREEV